MFYTGHLYWDGGDDLNDPLVIVPFFESTACADITHGPFSVVMTALLYLFGIRILRMLTKIYYSSS